MKNRDISETFCLSRTLLPLVWPWGQQPSCVLKRCLAAKHCWASLCTHHKLDLGTAFCGGGRTASKALMAQLIKDVVWLSEDYSCNGSLPFGAGLRLFQMPSSAAQVSLKPPGKGSHRPHGTPLLSALCQAWGQPWPFTTLCPKTQSTCLWSSLFMDLRLL